MVEAAIDAQRLRSDPGRMAGIKTFVLLAREGNSGGSSFRDLRERSGRRVQRSKIDLLSSRGLL
jgi:hypothetical protein